MFGYLVLVLIVLAASMGYADSSNGDRSKRRPSRRHIEAPNVTWSIVRQWSRRKGSRVYEVLASDGMTYAVKEILFEFIEKDPEMLGGEERRHEVEAEASILSRFQHKHIINYLGCQKKDKNVYLFYEFMRGASISYLYEEGKLEESKIAEYTRQVLRALRFLHKNNVVHRDVNCSHILLDDKGVVKLAGFHFAEEIDATTIGPREKQLNEWIRWAAPEIISPTGQHFGTAVDIWSLGCTVLEMATREYPYSETHWVLAMLEEIFNGNKPLIPDTLSADLKSFIESCLQSEPLDRPTASQLLRHPFVSRARINGSPSPPSSPDILEV